MKAVLLVRVSDEDQRKAMSAQGHRIKQYAARQGWEIIKEFEFDESAYKTKREQFTEVIELLKKESQKEKIAVCCDKIDRLLRNFTIDLQTLEDLRKDGRLELHFPSDNIVLHRDSPATDLFRFTMGVSLARYYSDSISDNVKRRFEQMRRDGLITHKAPLGYMHIILEGNQKWVVPDPERAPFVKKAFELYATGNYSITGIVEILTRDGFTNNGPARKPITRSQLHRILRDPFYYGEVESKGQFYPHKYEPLIDKALFDQCVQIRQGRKPTDFKYKSKPFALRGLLRCGYCGCMISADRKKNKYTYLKCNQYKGKCEAVRVREEVVLDQVSQLFASLKLPDRIVEQVKEALRKGQQHKINYHQNALKTIDNEYQLYQNRLDEMYLDKLDGRITSNDYDKLVAEFKQKQRELDDKRAEHTDADEAFLIGANYLLDIASRAAELFESSKPDEKRQLLNFVLSNLKLTGQKLEFNLKEPFNELITVSSVRTGSPKRTYLELVEALRNKHYAAIIALKREVELLQPVLQVQLG